MSPYPADSIDPVAIILWKTTQILEQIDRGAYDFTPEHVEADVRELRAEARRAAMSRVGR